MSNTMTIDEFKQAISELNWASTQNTTFSRSEDKGKFIASTIVNSILIGSGIIVIHREETLIELMECGKIRYTPKECSDDWYTPWKANRFHIVDNDGNHLNQSDLNDLIKSFKIKPFYPDAIVDYEIVEKQFYKFLVREMV